MNTTLKKSFLLFSFAITLGLVSCQTNGHNDESNQNDENNQDSDQNGNLDNDSNTNDDDNTTDTYVPTLITPTGAPTLPAYKVMLSENIEVESPTDNTAIPAHFSAGDADFIIFDSTNAQNLLNKQGTNAKFEFVKMLTGGNFHLLGFNKDENDIPTNDDFIMGFMSNSTPGILFRNIYGNDMKFDYAADSIGNLQSSLVTMNSEYKIGDDVVDWAVVAEPANTGIKSKLAANGVTNIIDINLNTAFKEKNSDKWTKDFICQAGLFVNKDFKANHKEVYESTLNLINSGIDTLFNDLDNAYNEMTSGEYSDAQKFTAKFGFSSSLIKGVQGDNSTKNGFGVVPNDVVFTVDEINLFNELTASNK